ncbi:MAG: hypothetical protein ILO34_07525, partial [Kiritimatiellae bacterium]|nr:hypothetical protein [Kiritimatiellia bacterium]
DDDSVPASLVMPTVERVPMICGIQPNFQSRTITLESEWVPTGDPNSSVYAGLPRAMDGSGTPVDYNVMDGGAVDASTDGDTRKVCRTVKCSIEDLEVALSLGVNVAVVYPFAHGDDESDIDFTIDGRTAVFFTKDSDPMTTRAGTADDDSSDHWRVGNSHFAITTDIADGVISARLDGRQYSPPDNIDNMNEAVEIVSLPCKEAFDLDIAGHPFIYYTRVWDQTFSVNPSTGLGSWNDIGGVDMYTAPIEEVRCAIPPQTPGGIADSTLAGFLLDDSLYTGDLKLNLAVWVRVTDESGRKAYDMAPASIQDDAEFNDIYGGGPKGSVICESTFPVMRFDIDTGSVPIPLSPSALPVPAPDGKPLTLTISPQAAPGGGRSIMVADPRYNYAPESWFATAGDLSPDSWLAAINDTLAEGDGDIFMSVSDQGYMQSVYELAFLPRLTNLDDAGAGGSSLRGNCIKESSGGIANFYSGKTQTLNYRLMWKTFDLFDPVEAERMREFNIFQGAHGQRVNPYSDSTNVLMAVFANTPVDWRCASTNNVDELEKMSASSFNSKHAWCGYSSVASQQLEYSDLEQVAGNFIYSIRSGGVGYDWQTAWENLWLADTGEPDQLCGVDLTGSSANIWEADRKFLYGFWRECFAARQQLFLIFVRAEPLMIGGEGIDQASPQLSSRAVALVWRDPAPVAGVGGYPHRTRILFYRPLE